jgi:uncharacterized protein YkwD
VNVVGALFALYLGLCGAAPQPYSTLADRAYAQVNEFRRAHAREPLTLDPLISEEARKHSAEMARIGKTLSHRGFDARLEDIRKGIPVRAGAENVAAAKGQSDGFMFSQLRKRGNCQLSSRRACVFQGRGTINREWL